MKINHNLSAITANNQLLKTEDHLAGVMERLSSGLSINHAKDNPAGMAISHKMQTQIDGLNRASDNASDGKAVIEIADGALGEVTEMLQRMRELCVQAANDTNGDDDKAAIQAEIAELKEEVNRVSSDTEYNTMKLLDGSQNSRVYSDTVSRLSVSKYVDEGIYNLKIKAPATQASYSGNTGSLLAAGNDYHGPSGSISINGYIVGINDGDTAEQVYEKLRNGAEKGECFLSQKGTDPITLTSTAYGKDAEITVSVSNSSIENYLKMVSTDPNTTGIPHGSDADIELDTPNSFSEKATVRYQGNHIVVSDTGAFEISFYAYDDITQSAVGSPQWCAAQNPTATTPVDVSIEVTDIGNMTLQVGANQHQTITVEIPEITCEMMYIDDLDVTTVTGADRGIAKLDSAISYVSSARSRLGAYENRLDHTIADLESSSENLTKALSGLTDADMAEEMVDYTTYNVLDQAGVSVLTQANDLPQTVLQLLQ